MKKKLSFILFWFLLNSAFATEIKVGILAPDGTTWAKYLKKIIKDVDKATNGEVKIKVYYGGAQGDESDVLRKIRVGQLHGGIFTGKTLSEIYGDVRIMEVPFTFYDDYNKASQTLKKMTDYFNSGFEKNGFVNLGFYELGQVYFISKKKATSIDGMKGMKIWLWEGDKLVSTLISNLGLVGVPLAMTDVLTSLQTGILEATYAPPMAILAVQWNTKVNYLINFPIAFSMGAFLVDNKAWLKVPEKYRAKVKEICFKYSDEVNKKTVEESQEALDAMKSTGMEFVEFSKEDIKKSNLIRAQVIKDLEGKVLSKKVIEIFSKKI